MSNPWFLYYGKQIVPLQVVQDVCHSGMWRIAWPDGRLSDMVNLSRAKDAATLIAQQEDQSLRDPTQFDWKRKAGERRAQAPPIRQNGLEAAE